MAIANDIIQVTHDYRVQGERCLNVFYYRLASTSVTPISLEVIGNALSTRWQSALAIPWTTVTVSNSIRLDNLTDGLTFAEVTTGWAGTTAKQPAPSLVAVGFKLARASKLTRNGSKRVSGLPEDIFDGNSHTIGGTTLAGLLSYVADDVVFNDTPNVGDTIELTQVIVGRTLNASGVYVLDLTKVNEVTGVSINPLVTSQVSRKPRS